MMKRTLKRFAQRYVRSRGYHFRKEPGLGDFLSSRSVEVLLDVGANTGHFAMGLRDQGYKGRIVSFEPVKEVYSKLLDASKADPSWEARNVALGDVEGVSKINVSQYAVFSSMLDQTEVATAFDPEAKVVRSEEVAVKRLDDIYPEWDGKKVFLKVDTQGFEQAVLKGGAKSLDSIVGVQMELPIEHLYEGVWSFEGALAYMRERGFVVSQIRPANVRQHVDPASFIEVDCVFRRSDGGPAHHPITRDHPMHEGAREDEG